MIVPSPKIKHREELETGIGKILLVEVELDELQEEVDHTIIGIDPGTAHMGIAVLYNRLVCNRTLLYEIKIKRGATMIDRLLQARNVLVIVARDCDLFSIDNKCEAVIEGSAFSRHHRQTEMAEQRATLHLWLYDNGVKDVTIKQPNSVRKQAFGYAKVYAKEVWPMFPENSAAALGCALSAVYKEK